MIINLNQLSLLDWPELLSKMTLVQYLYVANEGIVALLLEENSFIKYFK